MNRRIVDWDMVVILVVCAVVIWALGVGAQIATYKSDGYLPPVIAVSLNTPDTARICAEREHGITDCRTVGELRKWLRERIMK